MVWKTTTTFIIFSLRYLSGLIVFCLKENERMCDPILFWSHFKDFVHSESSVVCVRGQPLTHSIYVDLIPIIISSERADGEKTFFSDSTHPIHLYLGNL